ncbi:MAG: LysM peptidoglycan-binding domain-containing protein, partial [Candidatus Omnitrophica bacterium]|nr:LysM peptidoglycan-binding domain-containing protein [Candidatus Omnitrophota bacterium]
MKRIFRLTAGAALAIILSSCAQAPVRPPVHQVETIYTAPVGIPARQNICHVVAPGETLWRIAKMYDVDIDDIMRANGLKSRTQLNMGQRLTIPRAAPLKPVIPLYETSKWKYIIIHHSATEAGNALRFYKYHRGKGWGNLGY